MRPRKYKINRLTQTRIIWLLAMTAVSILVVYFASLWAWADEAAMPAKIAVSSSNEHNAILHFPTGKGVRAVAFRRDMQLWVVFDRALKLDIPTGSDVLEDNRYAGVFKVIVEKQLAPGYTCFVIELAGNNGYEHVYMQHQENGWELIFSGAVEHAPKIHSIEVQAKKRSNSAPYLALDAGESFHSLQVKDGDTGATITLIPLHADKIGMMEKHRFIDLTILPSIQGVAIESYNDSLTIEREEKEIQISSSSGLNITSPEEGKGQIGKHTAKMENATKDKPILPLQAFKVDDAEFEQALLEKQRKILDNTQDIKRAHLDLALFYATHGFFRESFVVIENLKKAAPKEARSYEVGLINTAVAYLDNNAKAAQEALAHINPIEVEAHQRQEFKMWQDFIAATSNESLQFTDWAELVRILSKYRENFLAEYGTQPVIKLALDVFEGCMKGGDLGEAKKLNIMLENLQPNMSSKQYNQLLYLRGSYYQERNESNLAVKTWQQCAEEIEDPMHSTRCRFAKAQLCYKRDKMNRLEYQEELEKISTIWRGDALEYEALKALSNLYEDQNDAVKVLRAWQTIEQYYPDLPEASLSAQRIGNKLIEQILYGHGNLTPLEAVLLYYEFQRFVPLNEQGTALLMKLAADMVSLDLLDEAGALLEEALTKRASGAHREEMVNQLMHISLLNAAPQNALAVLQRYENGILPEHLAKERKYLYAEATAKSGAIAKMEELLKDDASSEAFSIRAEAYWVNSDWHKFSQNSAAYIQSLQQRNSQLNPNETLQIMRQIVAYMMMGHQEPALRLCWEFAQHLPSDNNYSEVIPLLSALLSNNQSGKDQHISSTVHQLISVLNRRATQN